VRLVLAEDQYLLRDGLSRLLQAHGFEITAAVADGASLVQALVEHRPGVAIIDVRLPPTFTDEGLQAALAARREIPGLPVVILSQHVEQLYARELLADGTGGVGYLLKDRIFSDSQFIDAVRRVAAGGTAMDPEVISRLVTTTRHVEPLADLTEREREVLELMAEGRSNAAIAELLHLSDSAVSKHIASIFTKLGLTPSNNDNRRVLAVLTYLNSAD
jgi:DNA-binding NarL/FixJ family response regulator